MPARKKQGLSAAELSWSLYDVANSAYILLVTAVIPIYLKSVGQAAGYDTFQVTTHWGIIQSAGTFVVALLSPVLGAMADYSGKKKRLFNLFLLLGLVSMFAMAVSDNYAFLLGANLLAALGYAGANNFYDAFLVDVTDDSRMDYISSLGYALGYVGSCIPFIASIVLILLDPFHMGGSLPVKVSFVITGGWWLLFSLPMEKFVRQRFHRGAAPRGYVRQSLKGVLQTLRDICRERQVALFLLAYFFYIDGVDTIIKMSTSFGADVGVPDDQMILALLVTQLVAFPAVLVMARLVKRFSAKGILLFSIAIYMGICVFGYFLSTAWQFWVLAICVAIVQGTIQALSRSYFGRLVPKERSNEYFGFYNILGKYATILGPLLMAVITAVTGSSRGGVLSIALLFVVGFAVLWRVEELPA